MCASSHSQVPLQSTSLTAIETSLINNCDDMAFCCALFYTALQACDRDFFPKIYSGVAGGVTGLEHPLSQKKKKKIYLIFSKNKNYRKYTCYLYTKIGTSRWREMPQEGQKLEKEKLPLEGEGLARRG